MQSFDRSNNSLSTFATHDCRSACWGSISRQRRPRAEAPRRRKRRPRGSAACSRSRSRSYTNVFVRAGAHDTPPATAPQGGGATAEEKAASRKCGTLLASTQSLTWDGSSPIECIWRGGRGFNPRRFCFFCLLIFSTVVSVMTMGTRLHAQQASRAKYGKKRETRERECVHRNAPL